MVGKAWIGEIFFRGPGKVEQRVRLIFEGRESKATYRLVLSLLTDCARYYGCL